MRQSIITPLRLAALCVALTMSACAHQTIGAPTEARIQAPPPPNNYVEIGSAEDKGNQSISIGISTNALDGDKDTSKLSLMFGFYFHDAAMEAKAAHLGTVGDGLTVKTPITFSPPLGGKEELGAILNQLAALYPDRQRVGGHLLSTPDQRYLVYITFRTASGPNAIYFDISRWVEYRKTTED